MTAANYENCLKVTLAYEGGYSNHPADPGGVTLEGVIQRVYNSYRDDQGKPRRALTPAMRGTTEWIAERNDIYRRNYWNAVVGDQWPAGPDLVVWDCGVNSGPERSRRFCKVLLPNGGANFSGMAASCRAMADKVAFVKQFCKMRMAFVQGLSTWASFGKGWASRIANVEVTGVRMALAAAGATPAVIKDKLKDEAKQAETNKKVNQGGAAGGAAAGGGAGQQTQWSGLDWSDIAIIVAVIAACAVVTIYCIHWWRNHSARAKAYAAAALLTEA